MYNFLLQKQNPANKINKLTGFCKLFYYKNISLFKSIT